MLIGIFGENCSGKSTLAAALQEALGAEILSGKDYLRLAKSPTQAAERLKEKMKAAISGEHLIYVFAEPEQLAFLPEGAVKISVKADLETIKARFRERMHGQLPPPVEQMLERRHGAFDSIPADYSFDGVSGDAAALCQAILEEMG